MKESIIILECKCGYRWVERLALPMIIQAAIVRMKGWNVCPKCGLSKDIAMLTGEKYHQACKDMAIKERE